MGDGEAVRGEGGGAVEGGADGVGERGEEEGRGGEVGEEFEEGGVGGGEGEEGEEVGEEGCWAVGAGALLVCVLGWVGRGGGYPLVA